MGFGDGRTGETVADCPPDIAGLQGFDVELRGALADLSKRRLVGRRQPFRPVHHFRVPVAPVINAVGSKFAGQEVNAEAEGTIEVGRTPGYVVRLDVDVPSIRPD